MNGDAIARRTDGFPISLNMACRILRMGKDKVRKLLGTEVRRIPTNNNQYGYNLKDVLELVGSNKSNQV